MPSRRTVKRLGWNPDLPDHRDFIFKPKAAIPLPPKVDLRPQCPPVYDQGNLGSCTANAIGALFQFDLMKQGFTPFVPSRLFIYYNEREVESTVAYDSGAQIRDGMKVVAELGVCSEDDWPYKEGLFTVRPPQADFTNALQNKSLVYERIDPSIDAMKTRLAEGWPFVCGITVYDSFMSPQTAATGIVQMPGQERQVGGHAILAVGYDDTVRRFIIRNSWGADWGQAGYFEIPYDYLINPDLADDFWTASLVN